MHSKKTIEKIRIGSIKNNPKLATCEASAICNFLRDTVQVLKVVIMDNLEGCNTKEEVVEACIISAVDDPIVSSKFSIFPNPSSDIIYIESENGRGVDIRLLDQLGQEVLRDSDVNEIQISDIAVGIYFLELIIDRQRLVEKVLIAR